MIPIYEQGGGRGHGLQLDSFLERFDQICVEHKRSGRAKAFAFIFYDFLDRDMKTILKDQGVFTQLDRLSGADLSIFFLHTGTRRGVEEFNSTFLRRLEVAEKIQPPCVVFFKLHNDAISDVSVAALDSADLLHGFKELHDVIEGYLKNEVIQSKYIRWIKGTTKFVALEGVKEAIKYGIGL